MTRPPRNLRDQRDERGAATLLVTSMLGVLLLATVGVAGAGRLLLAHHRVQASADLAAVAGADALAQGSEACDAAESIARANGAELEQCLVDGPDVTVSTTVAVHLPTGYVAVLTGRARAGPD